MWRGMRGLSTLPFYLFSLYFPTRTSNAPEIYNSQPLHFFSQHVVLLWSFDFNVMILRSLLLAAHLTRIERRCKVTSRCCSSYSFLSISFSFVPRYVIKTGYRYYKRRRPAVHLTSFVLLQEKAFVRYRTYRIVAQQLKRLLQRNISESLEEEKERNKVDEGLEIT